MNGSAEPSVVRVRDLTVELVGSGMAVVEAVSFDIAAGDIVGLVGESGSGKTTVGTALLGHCRPGAQIRSGTVEVLGRDITKLTADEVQALRAKVVSYVPQDPTTALNPALRIGLQLRELLDVHDDISDDEARNRVERVLRDVKLPADAAFLRRFPHQLSGGQQQRVCLAMAFLLEPKVVVLDEPTTGLDVTSQAHVLDSVRALCKQRGTAALYVTHDLAVVANLADSVMVMYAGELVETGSIGTVLSAPAHPYTQRLLAASPDVQEPRRLEPIAGHAPALADRSHGCSFNARCTHADARCQEERPHLESLGEGHLVACHHLARVSVATPVLVSTKPSAPAPSILSTQNLRLTYGAKVVVPSLDLSLAAGECLALVGESGSGKTTIGRSIVGLKAPADGSILFDGTPLAPTARGRSDAQRRSIQYVFQNPYASLNPRRTIGDILAKPIRHFHGLRGDKAMAIAADALQQVALRPSILDRYPRHLSGGERQRVAIARALVCEPQILVCDEVTSALDVSVQAAVVELLANLREQRGLSILFVTHNLALVRSFADRVVVLHDGVVVEAGTAEQLFESPNAPYTQQLLNDTPSLSAATAESPRRESIT